MLRPQFSVTSLLWLMVVVSAFFGGYELARLRGDVARDIVLEELRTERYVLGDMRIGARRLRDENLRLREMLKIEKQRIDKASAELATTDNAAGDDGDAAGFP